MSRGRPNVSSVMEAVRVIGQQPVTPESGYAVRGARAVRPWRPRLPRMRLRLGSSVHTPPPGGPMARLRLTRDIRSVSESRAPAVASPGL